PLLVQREAIAHCAATSLPFLARRRTIGPALGLVGLDRLRNELQLSFFVGAFCAPLELIRTQHKKSMQCIGLALEIDGRGRIPSKAIKRIAEALHRLHRGDALPIDIAHVPSFMRTVWSDVTDSAARKSRAA